MQAIVVRYLGPSRTRPSRWQVLAGNMRKSFSKNAFHEYNDDLDARMAAESMALKLKWPLDKYGPLIEGGLPNGDRVFVFSRGP